MHLGPGPCLQHLSVCPKTVQGHQDAATKRHARERFSQIRAAFEVLRDPELRQQYDNGQHVKP